MGQLVHYSPEHGQKENGIVKSITDTAVFVVYNCGGYWTDYHNYTAANTNPRDLMPEWVHDAKNVNF